MAKRGELVPLSPDSASAIRIAYERVEPFAADSEGSMSPGESGCATDTASCPVQALGHRDDQYWCFGPSGELRVLKVGQLYSSAGLQALFGGDVSWLLANHPKRNVRGEIVGFSVGSAANDLVRRCRANGLFDARTPIRGRGAWVDAEIGQILHVGDALLNNGTWTRPGIKTADGIYAAAPPIPRPDAVPAAAETVSELRDALLSWTFAEPGAAEVIVGFIALAFLGAAAPYRANLYVVGPYGSGKTSLAEFVHAVASPMARLLNDVSPAGVRQALSAEPQAIILDEAEGDGGAKNIQAVIGLIRRGTTGSGARIVRGTRDGTAVHAGVIAPAYLTGICPPPFKPQDASRFTVLELLGASQSRDLSELLRQTDHFGKQSLALWARALSALPRFLMNFEVIRRALTGDGCQPRHADQAGILLAAWFAMARDAPVEPDELPALLPCYAWMIRTQQSEDAETGDVRCLQHLLGSYIWQKLAGARPTIGQLLVDASLRSTPQIKRILDGLGLRLVGPPEEPSTAVFIANRHPNLAAIFKHTDWADGAWSYELRRLPGAKATKNSVRLGASKCRGTLIPWSLICPPDDVDDSEAVS